MRSRNIKPGFFKNECLGSLPFEDRLLFVGLWCLSDREGFFEYRPKKIAAEIFPYDSKITEKIIDVMTSRVMSLHLIAVQGQFGYIPKFKNHQNPHPHEAKSCVPEESKNILKKLCNDNVMTLHGAAVLNPESCILNPYKNTLSKVKTTLDPACLEIYETLKAKIVNHRPNQKFSGTDKDLKKIDCMLRLDNRDSKRVLELLHWYPIGQQYIPEIFSAQALREKYDKLETAFQRSKKNDIAAYDGAAVIRRMVENEKYKKDLEEASKKLFGE